MASCHERKWRGGVAAPLSAAWRRLRVSTEDCRAKANLALEEGTCGAHPLCFRVAGKALCPPSLSDETLVICGSEGRRGLGRGYLLLLSNPLHGAYSTSWALSELRPQTE